MLKFLIALMLIVSNVFAQEVASIEDSSKDIASIEVPLTPLNIAKPSDFNQTNAVIQPENNALPSVKNVHDIEQEKFDAKVKSCIGSDVDLQKAYEISPVKQAIAKQFSGASLCDDIIKTLKEASGAYNKMQEIKNDAICNVENIDPSALTQAEVDHRKEKIEKNYNTISTQYTKYFTYTEDIAVVEMCMNYYNSFTITNEINSDFIVLSQEVEKYRRIIQAHELRGFYGEARGMLGIGIIPFVNDVQTGMVTISQASNYAIFEPIITEWELAGAMDDYLIYTHNAEVFIAIPFVSGVSYSADRLPHQLFVAEKKIEFPKKGYSIFILKPLE
jgi:hypothetical protein